MYLLFYSNGAFWTVAGVAILLVFGTIFLTTYVHSLRQEVNRLKAKENHYQQQDILYNLIYLPFDNLYASTVINYYDQYKKTSTATEDIETFLGSLKDSFAAQLRKHEVFINGESSFHHYVRYCMAHFQEVEIRQTFIDAIAQAKDHMIRLHNEAIRKLTRDDIESGRLRVIEEFVTFLKEKCGANFLPESRDIVTAE